MGIGTPMIVDQDVQVQAPSVDDFAPKYLNELQEDVILDKKFRYSQRGDMEFLQVVLKRNAYKKINAVRD